MIDNLWFWIAFNAFILALLAVDLLVFNRKGTAVTSRSAAMWSAFWIILALLFGLAVFLRAGSEPGMEFLAGYLIEKSLSVDNIFVFVLLFTYFNVPSASQRRVLFWGILMALVMRGAMIGVGSYLIKQFHWTIYIFGAFLVLTGIRMARKMEAEIQPGKNPLVRLVRRLIPVTDDYRGSSFFVREGGRLMATPLLIVFLLVNLTDLVFALDSIPAIFAVTEDPFLVYTSNVFAILGLRSLYFLLAGMVAKFRFLKPGLAAVLVFVGTKMLLTDIYKIPIGLSLAVIAAILAIAIVASLRYPGPDGREAELSGEDKSAQPT